MSTHTLYEKYTQRIKKAKKTIETYKNNDNLIDYFHNIQNNLLPNAKTHHEKKILQEKLENTQIRLDINKQKYERAVDDLLLYRGSREIQERSNEIFVTIHPEQSKSLYIIDCKTRNTFFKKNNINTKNYSFKDKKDIIFDKKKPTDNAIRIWTNHVNLENLSITDPRRYNSTHRNAIQLIPPAQYDAKNKLIANQFSGALLKNIRIENCKVKAKKATLRGIFSCDGLLNNINIKNNTIQTKAGHFISLCGLLRANISGNTLKEVEGGIQNPKINLYPTRIGGNIAEEGLVYILSFHSNEQYQYDKVTVDESNPNQIIHLDGTKSTAKINDQRTIIPNRYQHNSIGLHNFRYQDYLDKFNQFTFSDYEKYDNVGYYQLHQWLDRRISEFSHPSTEEQKQTIIPQLKKAKDALIHRKLDNVRLPDIQELPLKIFAMKRLAIKHSSNIVLPLKPNPVAYLLD